MFLCFYFLLPVLRLLRAPLLFSVLPPPLRGLLPPPLVTAALPDRVLLDVLPVRERLELPELLALDELFDARTGFARPLPLCLPPPSCLFTVAHAMRSASSSGVPRCS